MASWACCCGLQNTAKRKKCQACFALCPKAETSVKEDPNDDAKYRSSFNTPFYRRQNENIGKMKYFIDKETVETKDSKEFMAVLCDSGDEETQLRLAISRVIDNVIRISVTELHHHKTKKKRYEINSDNDVLTKNARIPLSFSSVESTDKCAVLLWNTYSAKIFYEPFAIYVFECEQLQIVINSSNTLYFETYSNTSHSETSLKHRYSRDFGPASIGLDFDFLQLTKNEKIINVYGIPSHSTALSLPSTNTFEAKAAYRMYNLDVHKYKLNSPSTLYGSIPYIINHNSVATNSILWCNSSETFVQIKENNCIEKLNSKNVRFMSETCALETFLLLHTNETRKSYLSQYYALTGVPQLPPLFALGHHQCRWNYIDEKDVMDINDKFNEYNCPNDVIWLDIEHTHKKQYFTWDSSKFPDPQRLIDYVANDETKRKLVCIVDPHIKKDDSYFLYTAITETDLWVKTRKGHNFEGKCWPGQSLYPDFVNPKMRELWSEQFKVYDKDIFVWNDMNEPSVFDGPEGTMPCSLKHCDGTHYDLRHEEIHNLYGYYLHKASFEGLLRKLKDSNKRPFLLSRSFFIGSHKYGAIWTGDNKSNWDHLQISVPMLLSLSVAGMPFVGADIGGFFGNCGAQLMQRWYNLGMFYPFFRNHCIHRGRRQEFWRFDFDASKGEKECRESEKGFRDQKCMESMRNSIIERYKLLPYIYTLFFLSHSEGHPIMRPIWYEFEKDIDTFDRDDAFMFGDALFVVPIMKPGMDKVSVTLPHRESVVFYEMRDGNEGLRVNVYARDENESKQSSSVDLLDYKYSNPVLRVGGKLTVEKHRFIRRSSALMSDDPITIIVALDRNGFCKGKLYLDDGETLSHLDSSEYVLSECEFERNVFRNKILHFDENINRCDISQIWILMSEPNIIPIQSVFMNSKQFECDYKTPHLCVIDNVNIAVNSEFEIVFK